MDMDTEPTLESIEDYDTLKGEKKKIVWIVIISGLLIGLATYFAFEYSEKEESMAVDKTFKQVPLR